MMLAARSMLHFRPPAPGLSVHTFVAAPGRKRCPCTTWGPSTSLVTCATNGSLIADPRPVWPGRGGGGGAHEIPNCEEGTADQQTSKTLLKHVGSLRKQGNSSKGGRRTSGGRGREQIESQHDLADRNPRVLTTMIKACEDLTSLQALALSHGNVFNYIHVSAMMVEVAKACTGDNADEAQHLMLQLSATALKHLDDMGGQGIANILWAVAKVGGVIDASFTSSLMLAAMVKLPEFNAQNLANSLWAAATLGIRDEPFISSWLLAAKLKLPEFNAQELANTLFSAAKLGIRDAPFIYSWLLAAKPKLS